MPSRSDTVSKQQLYEAVLMLASEESRIEERLARVYFGHIRTIDASSLPVDVRPEWNQIRDELMQMYPQPGKIDGVNQTAAVNLAMRIILVYDSMIK